MLALAPWSCPGASLLWNLSLVGLAPSILLQYLDTHSSMALGVLGEWGSFLSTSSGYFCTKVFKSVDAHQHVHPAFWAGYLQKKSNWEYLQTDFRDVTVQRVKSTVKSLFSYIIKISLSICKCLRNSFTVWNLPQYKAAYCEIWAVLQGLSAAPHTAITLLLLVEQQPPPTKSLLSILFVQPCHSLATPPQAVWMDRKGQYTDPACPLTVYAANNRGLCVLQTASQQH